MTENIAGFNAAEKYARERMRDEQKMRELNRSGIPLHELPKTTIAGLRSAAGLPKKKPSPPKNAIEYLKYGRHDPEKNRKAHGGYVKKYARGGGVLRKSR